MNRIDPPAFHRAVIQLYCSACRSETNATCSCGKPYVPAQQRVAEYDKANPGRSTRQAAADLDVDHSTVVRARGGASAPRADQSAPGTVTGKDGKVYAARKIEPGGEIARIKRLYGEDLKPPPIQQDLRNVAVGAFEQMNLTTLQAVALDFDRIYWARRNKKGSG